MNSEVSSRPAATGSAVLGIGDDRGVRSVAIWHTDRRGLPGGAWVVPPDEALVDRDAARAVLALLAHRPVTGECPADLEHLLAGLCAVADVDCTAGHVRRRTFSPLDAVEDAHAYRVLVEMEIKKVQDRRPGVSTVEWRHGSGLVTPPRTTDELQRIAAVRVAGPSALTTEVLGVASGRRWLTELWAEIGAVLQRRPYLAERLAPAPELPARWWAAARAADQLPLFPPTPRIDCGRTTS